ncbi:hypothetical protein [Nocardioides ganghwensis]|uniref:Uncharacterized protein n=1 Tax=Nocardioides ganghwensis TaxID=252230 RepID=A0A4Q2S8M1_9ACTN|nr:hypothetical protein [Nocardioides ganghwensis]MBD3946974.1 hypothetical protein [Nocardioides ganghwensis]RYB96889.1 hypothetical protein EUA07_21015 [Nocardioides ganghwensis]
MYNLIIGMTSGNAGPDRFFEYTEDPLRTMFTDASGPAVDRLTSLPTLLMPELQQSGEAAVARVGRVTSLRRVGRDYRFTFVPHPHLPAIPLARVVALSDQLGVASEWEWNRTHWAVKNADLFEISHELVGPARLEPRAFTFPTGQAREPDLVAVMMPFAGFDSVYHAIKSAATDAGFQCLRADDIWEHEHILDDVISLIWRAQVIISDFTGRNANVFYETGIAHSLGRTVIPITQTMSDVPFDLQAIRAQRYLSNGEGLEALREKLTAKLASFR